MTLPWSGEARGAYISENTVILFILTLGSAGTNLSILAYLALSLWTDGADIPFDALYTRLSPSQRGVVVIALTFPSYYMLSGRNLIPYQLFLPLSLTSPLVSVSSYLSPSPSLCHSIRKKKADNTSMSNPVRKLLGTWAALWCYTIRDPTSLVNNTQGVSAVFKVHMCAGSFTGHVFHQWDHERCVRVCCDKCRHLPASLHTKTPWGEKKKNTEFGHKETKQAFDW